MCRGTSWYVVQRVGDDEERREAYFAVLIYHYRLGTIQQLVVHMRSHLHAPAAMSAGCYLLLSIQVVLVLLHLSLRCVSVRCVRGHALRCVAFPCAASRVLCAVMVV